MYAVQYYAVLYCIVDEETDMLVRDRGLLYYRLLKTDVSSAKKIVCGSQKVYSHLATHSKVIVIYCN